MHDCSHQEPRTAHVALPKKLVPRWSAYIGDPRPKIQYLYRVLTAVHQAGSTPEAFRACWQRYRRAAKSKGEKHFHEDVFQRFCAAGFGRTTVDSRERRLEFVRRILTEYHGPGPLPAPVQVGLCLFVVVCVCNNPVMYIPEYICMSMRHFGVCLCQ